MNEVEFLVDLLGLSADDVVKALLTAFVPLQPGVLRANWLNNKSRGNSAPSTAEIWTKFVEADFRCTLCGSHRRITLDHIDGNAANHAPPNLRVVCYDCNRKVSKKGTQDADAQLRIFRSYLKMREQLGRSPANKEILADAGVQQIGGATYLLKFLAQRLNSRMAEQSGEREPPMTQDLKS